MPKGKPARSRRKRTSKPVARPPAAAAYRPPPAVPQDSEAAPAPAESAFQPSTPQPSATRFSTRDYTFVRREVRRIALLAVAIIITIVVLSFFLP